jgi:DNA (cytosine-5)-methyltransferase 1
MTPSTPSTPLAQREGQTSLRPRALDLFCKAGGVTRGLQRAGFHVTGVDIKPQPRYVGDAFHQADAMTFDLSGFGFIHASPPCQKYSTMTKRWGKDRPDEHPDLIAPTRARLKAAGVPYSMENVVGAPLIAPVMLCGSMFGLRVRRHRLFETSAFIFQRECLHHTQDRVVGVYGHAGGSSKRDGLKFGGVAEWREAMGIDWMTGDELAEAIPPAYAQWIGEQMMPHVLRQMEPSLA